MKRSFSFSEKPVLFILNLIPRLIPGIEKVVAVYWSPVENNLVSAIVRLENGEYFQESLQISDSVSILKRLRSENAQSTWLMKDDLAFEIRSKEKVQLNIFNEQNNNVLVVRIKNNFDSQNDLFFLYFNQYLSNFGTVNPNKVASTDNKNIIAHLVRNSILIHIDILENDKNVYATLKENTRSILQESEILKKQVADLQDWKKSGLIYLSNSYLKELSLENGRIYRFTETAVEKIREFSGNVIHLKGILEKAAKYADTMIIDADESPVMISDFHIYYAVEKKPEPVPESEAENTADVPVKYLKTLILLDRMEQAARQLKSMNKVLTSYNLGNEFPNPVTPPAISDALRKHKSKILHLFKEYPSRWQVIRNEFRPIQNILFSNPDPDKLTA